MRACRSLFLPAAGTEIEVVRMIVDAVLGECIEMIGRVTLQLHNTINPSAIQILPDLRISMTKSSLPQPFCGAKLKLN